MFFFQEGFTYRNFLMDVLAIFTFVVWFWLLIAIYGDLFRRHDISGWGKAIWVLALILTSYLGIFVYLITQGRGMAERNAQQAQQGLVRRHGVDASGVGWFLRVTNPARDEPPLWRGDVWLPQLAA